MFLVILISLGGFLAWFSSDIFLKHQTADLVNHGRDWAGIFTGTEEPKKVQESMALLGKLMAFHFGGVGMKRQLLLMALTSVIVLAIIGNVYGKTVPLQITPSGSVYPAPVSEQQQNQVKVPQTENYWTEVKSAKPQVKQGPVAVSTPVQPMPVQPKPPEQPEPTNPNPQPPPQPVWGMEHGMGHGFWGGSRFLYSLWDKGCLRFIKTRSKPLFFSSS